MRASSRRWHHSVSAAPGVNWPRSTCPSASSCASAASTVSRASARRSASADAACGPVDSSQPRTISASGMPGISKARPAAAIGGSGSAPGCAARASSSRSAATQKPASLVARRAPANSSKNSAHSGTGGAVINVSSASCNSSLSRTTGHDSAATCTIASGSSAPAPPETSDRSVPRNCTARALRSSSGASSR